MLVSVAGWAGNDGRIDMDLGLKGRSALVGGASAGLGRATAERLAAEGCKLALWSRGGDALERAADEIRKLHSVVVVTIAGDARDPATAAKVAWQAERSLGPIDIAVLNRGGPIASEATKTDPNEWRTAFQLLERRAPLVRIGLGRFRRDRAAAVQDRDVDRAEAALRLPRYLGRRGRIASVAGDGHYNHGMELADLVGRALQCLTAPRPECELAALGRQPLGRRPPESGGCAADKRGSPF